MSKSKQDWLLASMQLMIENGVDGITIASLTEHLKITKGSFYHHFRDISDFKSQMLAMCLEESTTKVIEQVNKGTTPLERLELLEDMAAANDLLEVAIRAWALRDKQAYQTLEEIDTRRIAYIQTLFGQTGLNETDAAQAAQLFYATFIGGSHLMPPLSKDQMKSLFGVIRQFYGIAMDRQDA